MKIFKNSRLCNKIITLNQTKFKFHLKKDIYLQEFYRNFLDSHKLKLPFLTIIKFLNSLKDYAKKAEEKRLNKAFPGVTRIDYFYLQFSITMIHCDQKVLSVKVEHVNKENITFDSLKKL